MQHTIADVHFNLDIYGNTVICSQCDRENRAAPTIAEKVDTIATAICKDFDIDPYELIFLEHYPQGRVDGVTRMFETEEYNRETWHLLFFNITGTTNGALPQSENDFSLTNPRWITLESVEVDDEVVSFTTILIRSEPMYRTMYRIYCERSKIIVPYDPEKDIIRLMYEICTETGKIEKYLVRIGKNDIECDSEEHGSQIIEAIVLQTSREGDIIDLKGGETE